MVKYSQNQEFTGGSKGMVQEREFFSKKINKKTWVDSTPLPIKTKVNKVHIIFFCLKVNLVYIYRDRLRQVSPTFNRPRSGSEGQEKTGYAIKYYRLKKILRFNYRFYSTHAHSIPSCHLVSVRLLLQNTLFYIICLINFSYIYAANKY